MKYDRGFGSIHKEIHLIMDKHQFIFQFKINK